jgi:cytochrome oxidase assembly protein ShyY1
MSSSVVTLGTITGQAFYGVALGGGTGDAGGTVKIPVALADGNTVFVAQGYGSSKHSSEVAIGTAYDVAGSTGAFKLNILGTTYKALKVVGLVPGDDAASEDEDTGGAVGRIYFLFNKSQFTGWKAVT